MMVPLTSLWLPIVLSTVAVFLLSNVFWMVLPFWHKKDFGKLPDQGKALEALTSAKSGQYMVPCMEWDKMSPEERKNACSGPMALVILRNSGKFSMGTSLAQMVALQLFLSLLVGYVAAVTLGPGTAFLRVLRVVGTVGILASAFGDVGYSIWYGKPWSATFKMVVDGVVYGLAMGAIFGWLWPH